MFAGGRRLDTFEFALPALLRFRPDLQGPDERVPVLDDLPAGSFLAHDPVQLDDVAEPDVGDAVVSIDEAGPQLLLTSQDEVTDIPLVWAHVRSFRSASFRFDVTLQTAANGVAYLVLSYGAVARTSIRLLPDRIDGVQLGADGVTKSPFTCKVQGVTLTDAKRMRFDVTPEKIVIKNAGIE